MISEKGGRRLTEKLSVQKDRDSQPDLRKHGGGGDPGLQRFNINESFSQSADDGRATSTEETQKTIYRILPFFLYFLCYHFVYFLHLFRPPLCTSLCLNLFYFILFVGLSGLSLTIDLKFLSGLASLTLPTVITVISAHEIMGLGVAGDPLQWLSTVTQYTVLPTLGTFESYSCCL